MTAEALLSELRARGVTLEAHGDRLKIRPSTLVTPEEVEQLRQHKTEVLALLTRPPGLRLDPDTVREALGDRPDPHDLSIVTFNVMAAVVWLEAEIRTGTLGQAPLLVRGRPLADWLALDTIARLLREGARR